MGRPKNIKTPESLYKLFQKYKQWVETNPIKIKDWVGKDGDEVTREKPIPLTFAGFECWLADNQYLQDLGDYEKNKGGRYKKFAPIIKRIKKECFVNKFNGAAAGIFQHNIIARELGLMDKTQITGDVENPVQVKITGMIIK